MENPDYLAIDGRQLRILLTIHQAGSLSGAARLLDMNQSTVSYWLDQLRERTGDPLFVRAGNGVEPTERAKALFPEAEAALRHVEAMFATPDYDPSDDTGTLRIAATAVERPALLKPLLDHARVHAPNITVHIERPGSVFQTIQSLQQGTLDIGFMPFTTSEGDGILRRKVATFRNVVFFDAQHPLPADDLEAFCARPQVRVALGPDASFAIDRLLAKLGHKRQVVLQVPDFDTALVMIKGTDIITTLPDTLSAPGLEKVKAPWEAETAELGMFWHVRSQKSARHQYWRRLLADLSRTERP